MSRVATTSRGETSSRSVVGAAGAPADRSLTGTLADIASVASLGRTVSRGATGTLAGVGVVATASAGDPEGAGRGRRAAGMVPVLRLCVWLALRILLRTAFRFRVRGAEGIPRTGPFVLAANHTSHVDTLALVASLPWSRVNDTPPLAAEDYFFRRRWLGALVRLLFNARPVDRQAGLETALTGARALLEAGHGVILYPEGTRSITGALGRFRRGVGSLLAGTSCPVIPVAIVGAHDVLPKGARWPRPGPVRLIMGDPVSYEREANSPEGWQRIAVDLERRVRALGEEARREATPARRALKLTRRAAVPSRPAFWPPFER